MLAAHACACASLAAGPCVVAGCAAGSGEPWPRCFAAPMRAATEPGAACSACRAARGVLLVGVCAMHRREEADLQLCRSCCAHAMLPHGAARLWQPQGDYAAVVLTMLAARALEQLREACPQADSWSLKMHSAREAIVAVLCEQREQVVLRLALDGAPAPRESSQRVFLDLIAPRGMLHQAPALLFMCAAPHSNLVPVSSVASAVARNGNLRCSIRQVDEGMRVYYHPRRRRGAPSAPQTPVGGARGSDLRVDPESRCSRKRRGQLLRFPPEAREPAADAAAAGPACAEWHLQFGCCLYCGLFLHPPGGRGVGLVNKFVLDVARGSSALPPSSFDIEHLAGGGVLARDPLRADAQVLLCEQCAAKTQGLAAEVAGTPGVAAEVAAVRGPDPLFSYLQRVSGMPDLVFCQLVTAGPDEPTRADSTRALSPSDGKPTQRTLNFERSDRESSAETATQIDDAANHSGRVREADGTAALLAHCSTLGASALLRVRFGSAAAALYGRALPALLHSPGLCTQQQLPACSSHLSVKLPKAALEFAQKPTATRLCWARCGDAAAGAARWVVCGNSSCSLHGGPYALDPEGDAVFRRAALLVANGSKNPLVFTPCVDSWERFEHMSPLQTSWVRRSADSDVGRSCLLANALEAANGHATVWRVFRRVHARAGAGAPCGFESPQARALACALPGVVREVVACESLHAYAFLLHVLGVMAFHELEHTQTVRVGRHAFLFLVWKKFVVDAGMERNGGGAIASRELLGLPFRQWEAGMLAHVRALVHAPRSRLLLTLRECQAAMTEARLVSRPEAALFRACAGGEPPATLHAMLLFAWKLENVAARADARACGFQAKRQLMLMHYVLAAFRTTDTPATAWWTKSFSTCAWTSRAASDNTVRAAFDFTYILLYVHSPVDNQ